MKIKKLDERAPLPTRGTVGAAGLDLYAIKDAVIEPGETKLLPTGLAIELPEDATGLVWDRSGLATKKGLVVVAGCIDDDFRGEIRVALHNISRRTHIVCQGERMAQLLVVPVLKVVPEWSDELSDTERGAGGFGSTGQ